MEINHIKEFIDLSQTLKFTRTAQHFFVSVSVVSRHISSLEEELGVKLFDRESRSVSLTESGKVFLESAKIISSEYDRALAQLALVDSQTTAVVHVGYLHNAARPFIANFVRYMDAHYPQIGVVLLGMKYRELYNALDDHTADLNFMLDPYPTEDSVGKSKIKIYDDELYVVANLESPLAKMTEGVHLSDLVGQNLSLPEQGAYPGLASRVRGIVAQEPRLSSSRNYIDIETLYLGVELGNCIGISSGFNRSLYGDRVAFLPILDVDTRIDVSAFWRRSLHGEALGACRAAIEHCRDTLVRWQPGDGVARPF